MNALQKFVCRLLTVVPVFVLGYCPLSHAQEFDSRIASVFLINFAKQVQWPPQSSSGDFVIGVVGNSSIISELKGNSLQVKINGRTIIVKPLGAQALPSEWKACHMVFVGKAETKALSGLSDTLGDAPVLVVGEGEGQKGSTINLFINKIEGRPKFELSRVTLEKHGLKATAMLLNLAVAI
ncbi:MAG: YfiR family protein [Bacteroidota bacterium]